MNATIRNAIITINNPAKAEVEAVKDLNYVYLCFQYEKGKKQTLHIHAYVEFESKNVTFKKLKKLLPRARIERRKGSQTEAINYCTKETTRVKGPYEYGTKRKQGKRNDLHIVKRKLDKGCGMLQIAQSHFGTFIRYHKGLEKYMYLKATERTKRPKVTVIYGPTGTGKSHEAWEIATAASSCYYKDNSKWWDGYFCQEVVVWDDFEMSCINYDTNFLLKLLDKYPFQVQNKGGYVKFNSPHIIFTSNYPPDKWITNESIVKEAFLRRIETIIYKNEPFQAEVTGNTILSLPSSPTEEEYDDWVESKDFEFEPPKDLPLH